MHFRPSSLLASTALLVLWGCPNFNVPSDTNSSVTINGTPINGTGGSAGAGSITATTAVGSGNTTEHDDAVDDQTDVAWVQQSNAEAGASPVRFLMTDAPIDADNVFITFCGIRVAAGVGQTKPADGTTPAPGAGGANNGGGGAAGAPAPSGGGAGDTAAAAADQPAGIGGTGGASGGGAGGAPAANAGASGSDPSAATPWTIISDQCQTLDLLTLQGGVTEAIGIGSLPPGSYGQIRLMVTEGTIVKSGLTQPLAVSPADAAEGFPVVGGFGVANGQPVTITIDFDAGSSIEYDPSQGFQLKPALRVIAVERAGAGDGQNGGSAGASGQPEKPSQGTGGAAGSSGQQQPPPQQGTGGNAGSGDKPYPPPPSGNAGACDGFAVLAARCSGGNCHGSSTASGLSNFAYSLDAAKSYVGKQSAQCGATDNAEILDPENPGASLIISKVSGTSSCGAQMPLNGPTLTLDEVNCLKVWIAGLAGAGASDTPPASP